MADLTAQPLGPSGGFNWVFLVDLLVCVVLAVFFLFYFNRLFAISISYGIRAFTWHKYRAYIDISALQISLLGGRLFFKSIRYHAHNETVLIHDGHITWRYWLRAVQEAEIYQDQDDPNGKERSPSASGSGEGREGTTDEKRKARSQSVSKAEAGGKQKKELPCRISVKVSGVEAFLYNRSPAYDGIIDAINKKAGQDESKGSSDGRPSGQNGSPDAEVGEKNDAFHPPNLEKTNTASTNLSRDEYQGPQIPAFLRMLPVKIECKKASAAVGNEHTTSVIVAKLDSAAGTVDAAAAGPLDIFKLLFKFQFKNVNVTMKPNRDFKQLQKASAQRILREQQLDQETKPNQIVQFVREFRESWHSFKSFFRWRKSTNNSLRTASMSSQVKKPSNAAKQDPIPGQAQWHGLMRYLDENEMGSNDEWQNIEYAKASTLVDCEQIDMRFYWDIPGPVPERLSEKTQYLEAAEDDDMNGSKPPAYGLDFAVHGGFIVYGPWADRQRINLQHAFFPASYVDAVPSVSLKPGETRVCTVFKIFISIEKDVTLRIPTRESSKDSKWQGRANGGKGGESQETQDVKSKHKRHRHRKRRKDKHSSSVDARPYAWLDVCVKADSTVNYIMDMFPRSKGYRSTLDLDVKGTEITSSVNHGLLWRAGALTMDADLSYANEWTALRDWPFKINCDDLELFILRDHMFLITDLVNDWSSGPPPEFYTFVPFKYAMELNFRNWVMYLNTNDANIINDPADFDKNEFLTLEGKDLHAVLGIPLELFRPKRNDITFDVLSQGMSMRMLSSARNTLQTLLPDKQVAELPKLTLKGSFCANQESATGLVDVLRMDLVGYGLSMTAYGFLVRHLINVKENYFGDYVHFKTLEEFQDAGNTVDEANKETASLPKPQTANEMDVILCIAAEEANVLFPTNLYQAKDFVRVELQHAAIDLRIASYYMDLAINFSPISVLQGSSPDNEEDDSPADSVSNTQLYIHHVDLDGHRAFGLPPNEPAYVATWYVDVGAITGECKSSFIHDLALAAKAFVFSFPDGENILPVEAPIIFFDCTFLQLKTDIVRVWLHVGKDALLVSTDPVSVDFNDWADKTFSQRVCVLVPNLTVACVDARSALRRRVREHRRRPVRTYAFFQTSIALNVVGRKLKFAEELAKQQAYVYNHDKRTHRVPFLLRKVRRPSQVEVESTNEDEIDPPFMPYPTFPPPISSDGGAQSRPASIKSVASFVSNRALKAKSSSSSLAASIRAGGLTVPGMPRGRRSGGTSSSSRRSKSSASDASSGYSLERKQTLPDDRERAKFGLAPSTMAFASSFAEPYFPLDMVEPDETNVPRFSATMAHEDELFGRSVNPDDLADAKASEDTSHTTIFIKIVPGVRAYVEPRLAHVAAKLLRIIQPKKAEDIMDDYQASVMGIIASRQQARHAQGNALEIKVDLPSVALRVCVPGDDEQPPDAVDLFMRSLSFMMRQTHSPTNEDVAESLVFHIRLASLQASIHEGLEPMPEDALSISVDDLTTWMSLGEFRMVHVNMRDAAVLLASDKVFYLAKLAERLTPLSLELQKKFEEPLAASDNRLHLLLWTLTQYDEHMGDPPFMSRMTYILRAYHDHFRNQESWKVLMRFRHTLQSLPENVISDLEGKFKSGDIVCPPNAPSLILNAWAQYRNWDVPNISRTTAFQVLFGDDDERTLPASEMKPIALTWATESLRVAIDRGEGASSITMNDIALGLELSPPKVPTGLMLVDENKRTSTTVHLHSGSIGFQLHWDLLKLVEGVIPMVFQIANEVTPQEQKHRSATQALEDNLDRQDFHIVFTTDAGSISLQSANLRHQSQAEGLRLSLIGTTQANNHDYKSPYGQAVAAVINADSAETELHSKAGCILQTLMTSPSIYIDHLRPAENATIPATVTIAGSYKELQIDVKEQVPGILNIVDHVIGEEVAGVQKIIRLIDQHKPAEPVDSDAVVPSTSAPALSVKFHVALLAGKLLLNISLLQALSYRLEGTAASIRVAPSLTKQHTFGIDFDVGKQHHSFINHSQKEDHQQGLLAVPPINGHIGLQLDDNQTRVSVATSIEQIEIAAAAIQGVAGVLSRPEVQDIIEAIKSGVEDLQQHINERFPEQPKPDAPKKETSNKLIVYDVRFALLGIRVSAKTPHLAGNSTAEWELGIGPLHAKASNDANIAAGDLSLFPEVRAKVQDVGTSLTIFEDGRRREVGNITLAIFVYMTLHKDNNSNLSRELVIRTPSVDVNAYPETAAVVVDVVNHVQDRIRELDLSREVDYLRRLRKNRRHSMIRNITGKERKRAPEAPTFSATDLLSMKFTVELNGMQVTWHVDNAFAPSPEFGEQDLVLSLAKVELGTRGGNEARLTIHDLQLQLVPKGGNKKTRTLNSALLPEMGFTVAYWSEGKSRSLALKATGKPLDLRLESRFIAPVNGVQKSIEHAVERFKLGTASWKSMPTSSGNPRATLLGDNHLASLQVEADFAGAEVYLQGGESDAQSPPGAAADVQNRGQQHGRYGQFAADGGIMHTSLKAPGAALKVEYKDTGSRPVVNGELRIDASTNLLLPNVVVLVREISASVKEVMKPQEDVTPATPRPQPDTKAQQRFFEDENIVQADPTAYFGKTKVNLGLRICRQEFGLTCQPIAKVDAKAELDDFYFTVNTIDAEEHGHFFAMSAVLTKLKTNVKHVYSREPTFSFDMESITVSLMNSKHFSGVSGLSAIVKINPTRTSINGKQLQDLLLFREIWLPPEVRGPAYPQSAPETQNTQADDYLVQRYQTVAAAAAFPWNATVSIAELAVDLDLGQSIGKSSFTINNLWASSQKTSNWEQNLCIGLDDMAVSSSGRMSGFIELSKLGVRTSIRWPEEAMVGRKTPLIQASAGFRRLRAKAAFDYQAFAFGDIEGFDFLMYNVQNRQSNGRDRLVAVLDCEKAYIFCTSTSPAQAFGLYQALDRLIQEKQAAFTASLKDVEKHLRRESTIAPNAPRPQLALPKTARFESQTPISLHTDVVVTLGTISVGAFPGTFFDSQILKLEANNIQARFAVGLENGRIHSGLGMTLGQLQVALASVKRVTVPKTLGDISVDEVINSAVNSKGGIILRVPKVVASMQTWQTTQSNEIDYIFKSLFEGKVDVGWNLSRINFIKGMYITHTRALAARLGKPLPESAVKITAGPQNDSSADASSKSTTNLPSEQEQQKITAEVKLPQSKYEYRALEPPVIETPQLRDMGEATPPLEWIGLNRDRLPNVTHQIIIVSLLEVVKEVEDAYERILGSS